MSKFHTASYNSSVVDARRREYSYCGLGNNNSSSEHNINFFFILKLLSLGNSH